MAIGAVVLVVLAVAGWVMSTYNGLVTKQQAVEAQWAQVENVYQRRADLVPNLVATVKGYAKHEKQTLQDVTEARTKATQIHIDPSKLDEASLKQFQQAQGQLGNALSRLLAVHEAYPDLKANTNFQTLQAQLEGTENRIAVERNKFNTVAQDYNVAIKRFPASMLAGAFGFESKAYFEAQAGADKAPTVSFD
ncbi:MAG: LemA family protein [Bacteroidales bacterium]|nr:LemA family protein [Bacteroidales bacterium]MDY3912922.1 LemA family protein [Sodaliphilus sp.]